MQARDLALGLGAAVALDRGASMIACAALARVVDAPPAAGVQAPEAALTGHH